MMQTARDMTSPQLKDSSNDDELPKDPSFPSTPEVLRCTRGGKVVGRCSLEDAYGEAQQAQNRIQLIQALRNMSLQEKLSCCRQLKEKGNAHYAAGEHLEAISCYEQGLMALDFGSSREQETDVQNRLLLPLLLNLAACLLKLRHHAKASAVCDIALRVDPECLKALYRRALAQKELGNLDKAKVDFRKILAVCEKQWLSGQGKPLTDKQQEEQHDSGSPNQQTETAPSDGQTEQGKHLSSPAAVELPCLEKEHEVAHSSTDGHGDASQSAVRAAEVTAVPNAAVQTMLLVQQCRRQLASLQLQQREYNAACMRMFKPQTAQKQERKPHAEEATVTDCKSAAWSVIWNNFRL